MNLKLLILSFLLFIKGSCLMAASFNVFGQVTNNGLPAPNQVVYVQATGADTNFRTDTLGNYFASIKSTIQNGIVRIFFVDCKGDTVEANRTFTNLTRSIYSRLQGCPPAGKVLVSGTVKTYMQASRFISVYFSKDNFRTYFDSTKTGLLGKFFEQYYTKGAGKLYVRIRDCEDNWIFDSLPYNASDTLSFTLNFCKNTDKVYHGTINLNSKAIKPDEAFMLRYKFNPVRKNFEFVDSISVNKHGSFHFPKDSVNEYLLKVLPTDASRFSATYYPNGIKWNHSNARSIGIHLNNPLRVYLKDYPSPSGTYRISGVVEVDNGFKRAGYGAVGIHLLDNSDKVIGFTYANRAGSFSFDNLDAGSYRVWIDQCGLPTENKIISLNANNPVEDNLVITANNNGVYFDEFLGLNEAYSESETQVYPNPFADVINLVSKDYGTVTVQDMMGRIVYSNNYVKNEEIRTDNWEEGVYLITVQNKKGLYRRKLVKK